MNGDATAPVAEGNKIIVHICNDIGGWGKGFVMALSQKWQLPEQEYRNRHTSATNFSLGEVQMVQVEPDLWVANLIGQHKINRDENGRPPIRYKAVQEGMRKICVFAQEKEASVHMPRIGCGLAGGEWGRIEPILKAELIEENVSVTVYDFG